MAMNSSGPISLGGTTSGQSIETQLGGSGTTTISLNCINVRNLAGVATGQITMPTNFYSKSVNSIGIFYGGLDRSNSAINTVTRFNICGSPIGCQTSAGLANYNVVGSFVGCNGLFYAGVSSTSTPTNNVTRINRCGSLVGSITTAGAVKSAGTIGGGPTLSNNGVFLGSNNTGCLYTNVVTRINACGALFGSETYTGNICCRTYTVASAGATVGPNGLFYSLPYCSCYNKNLVKRINACGALVGSITTIGNSETRFMAGAAVGSYGIFYGGTQYPSNTIVNCSVKINACGAQVGSIYNIGFARSSLGGAKVGIIGLFFGGAYSGGAFGSQIITRINVCNAQVVSEMGFGTGVRDLGGAGT